MYSRKKEPARVTALVSARHHQPRCEQAPGRRCQSSSQNVERGEVLELRTQRQGTLFPKSKDRANSSWLLVTWRRVRVQSTTNKVASLETLADMGAGSKSGWGGKLQPAHRDRTATGGCARLSVKALGGTGHPLAQALSRPLGQVRGKKTGIPCGNGPLPANHMASSYPMPASPWKTPGQDEATPGDRY